MLARMLREDGFRVDLTFDGATAISRLARKPIPDALLTDYRMPTVDGITVATYARSLDEEMPIFFLTGYPKIIASKSKELGAHVHPKPIDYAALRDEICSTLDKRLRVGGRGT